MTQNQRDKQNALKNVIAKEEDAESTSSVRAALSAATVTKTLKISSAIDRKSKAQKSLNQLTDISATTTTTINDKKNSVSSLNTNIKKSVDQFQNKADKKPNVAYPKGSGSGSVADDDNQHKHDDKSKTDKEQVIKTTDNKSTSNKPQLNAKDGRRGKGSDIGGGNVKGLAEGEGDEENFIDGVTIEGEGKYQIMEVFDEMPSSPSNAGEETPEIMLQQTEASPLPRPPAIVRKKFTAPTVLTKAEERAVALQQIETLKMQQPRRRKQNLSMVSKQKRDDSIQTEIVLVNPADGTIKKETTVSSSIAFAKNHQQSDVSGGVIAGADYPSNGSANYPNESQGTKQLTTNSTSISGNGCT